MSTSIIPVVVPVSGDGPIADVSSLVGTKTVTLTGTFLGTYTLLASHDNQTFAPVLTFDSNGLESINTIIADAYASMRLRAHASNPKNVSVTVAGELGPGQNFFSPVAMFAGSGGQSPIVDLSTLFPPTGLEEEVNFICSGSFTGSVLVEGSNDGTFFNLIGTFQNGALFGSQVVEFNPLSTPDKVRYVRVTTHGSVTNAIITVGGRIDLQLTRRLIYDSDYLFPFGGNIVINNIDGNKNYEFEIVAELFADIQSTYAWLRPNNTGIDCNTVLQVFDVSGTTNIVPSTHTNEDQGIMIVHAYGWLSYLVPVSVTSIVRWNGEKSNKETYGPHVIYPQGFSLYAEQSWSKTPYHYLVGDTAYNFHGQCVSDAAIPASH